MFVSTTRLQNDTLFSADFIKVIKATRNEKCIIPIQEEGRNLPFFSVPGLLLYKPLAECLGTNQPFYGFESPALYQKDAPVKGIAAGFIKEIKNIQPEGPYFLGAYCDHYEVIFEMAFQLMGEQDAAPLVVLFESYPPETFLPKTAPVYIRRKMRWYYHQLKGQSFTGKLKFIVRQVKAVRGYLRHLSWQGNGDKVNIRPYPGKVVLFKCAVPPPAFRKDAHTAWHKYITGDIEVYTIPGDHNSFLKYPAVVELGQKLSAILEGANKKEVVP